MKYHVYVGDSAVYHVAVDQDGEFNLNEIIKEAIKKIKQRDCARIGKNVLTPLEIYEETSEKQVWSKSNEQKNNLFIQDAYRE